MVMKQVKIDIPEGYEIDKDNSTFELIKFKEIKKQLPKSWEELERLDGCYVSLNSGLMQDYGFSLNYSNKNIFKTKEQAEASIALAQLSQLRDVYRQGWTPDWNDGKIKSCIVFYKNDLNIDSYHSSNNFLSFQSKEIAQEFLDNFKDLIIKAKPLMS
jgi:hypothetical protein